MPVPSLAREQDGVALVRQLVKEGLSREALAWRCRSDGPWQRAHGAVVLHNGPITERQRHRAALLRAGPEAVVGGRTAALLHGLRHVPPGPATVLLVPNRVRRVAAPGVQVVRTTRPPAPVVRDGLPLAPVARAVADAAVSSTVLRSVRALTAEAVQRGRCTVAELVAEHDAGPRRGRHLLGQALEDLGAGTRSAPEAEARHLVLGVDGLPEPRWNPLLLDLQGRFVACPDAWWEDADLVWEVDSVEHHLSPEDHRRTEERRLRLTGLGLHVVASPPSSIRGGSAEVGAHLLRAYQRWAPGGARADVRLGSPSHPSESPLLGQGR